MKRLSVFNEDELVINDVLVTELKWQAQSSALPLPVSFVPSWDCGEL